MTIASEENDDIESITSGVGYTAVIVNTSKLRSSNLSFWQKCGFNPSRKTELFDNKYMQLFTNKAADNMVAVSEPVSQSGLLIRHKGINDVLEQVTAHPQNPIKQVIILGSGFDVRATAYKNSAVSFFEVDQKKVLSTKEAILKKNQIDKNATYISIDYVQDDLILKLQESGVDFKKGTHFIWEGNSMYLPKQAINKLWNDIVNNFKGPLSLSMDYLSEDFINQISNVEAHKKAREEFKKANASFITGYNNIKEFAVEHKLKVVQNNSYSELLVKYGLHDQPDTRLEAGYLTHMIGEDNDFVNYIAS